MRLRRAFAGDGHAVPASARETQQGAVLSGSTSWLDESEWAAGAPAAAVALDLLLSGRSKFSQSLHNIVKHL
jgi:hypothetical protein